MHTPHPKARRSTTLIALFVALVGSVALHVGGWWLLKTNVTPSPKRTWVHFSFKEPAKLVGIGQSTPQPAPKDPAPEPQPLPEDVTQPPPEPLPEPPLSPKEPPKKDIKKKAPLDKPKENIKKKPKKPRTPKRGVLANQKKRKPKKPAPKTSPPKPLVHRNHTGEVPFKVRDIPSIRSVAPGNAALTAVLDLGRLRVSPWRKELLNVFEAYPDYHRVVGLSDIDPTQVYDKLLITTADPTSFTQTLMVANLRKKQPLQATQKQLASIVREDLVWTQQEGFPTARPQDIWWVQRIEDPRVFAIPAPNVLALAQPDHLPYLAARSRATRGNPRGFFPPLPPPIGAKEGTLPAVLVVELSRMHMRMGGAAATLPQPTAMRLVVHDDARPLIRLRMAFQNPEDAQRFLEQAPALVREFSSKILVKVMGYSGLLQRIQFRQDSDPSAAYIELRGTPDETRRILRLMARSIKSHTRALQPRPEDLPQDPSTAAQNALKIPAKDGTSSTSQEGPKSGSTTGRSLMDDAPPTSANPSLKLNPSVGSSTSQPSSSGGFGARRDALFAPKNAETPPKTSSTASSTSTRVEPTKNGGGGGQPTRGEEQEARER